MKNKDIIITNESGYPYNTRGGKLPFTPEVNATHNGIKSLG